MFLAAANQLTANLQNGFILLILGLGTVFVFLTVLILATLATSKLVKKYVPAAPEPKRPAPAAAVNNDSEIAAVIAAAYAKSMKK